MRVMRLPLILGLLGALLSCNASSRITAQASPSETTWVVQSSMLYDALASLNAFSADSFYVPYRSPIHERLQEEQSEAVQAAFEGLKRRVKDEYGSIISAFLALHASTSQAIAEEGSLQDLITEVQDPIAQAAMQSRLRQTAFYSDAGWDVFVASIPDLVTVLRWLDEREFEAYWRAQLAPVIEEWVAEVEPRLPGYDVIGIAETVSGRALPSDTLTVYALSLTRPHGIRVAGTHFLTDVSWPFENALRIAGHEMLHPPFDVNDPSVLNAIETLQTDPFVAQAFEQHDPSFGYNSFPGYVDEDLAQALDQLIAERFDVAQDPRARWRHADGGMHVLAAAIYAVMREETYLDQALNGSGETAGAFLVRQVRSSGALRPGHIEAVVQALYAEQGGPP